MKNKSPVWRSVIIIAILIVSALVGLIYSMVWSKIDEQVYSREYSELVEKYAEEYAVPEYIIYAVMKTESGFDSGAVGEDGGVGRMGVYPEGFDEMLLMTREDLTGDALYGPETNIKYGTYRLSILYNRFEKWSYVYAAWNVDMDVSESWLDDDGNYNEDGIFVNVPNEDAVKLGEKLEKCVDKYREMYY